MVVVTKNRVDWRDLTILIFEMSIVILGILKKVKLTYEFKN